MRSLIMIIIVLMPVALFLSMLKISKKKMLAPEKASKALPEPLARQEEQRIISM